eukprot:GHRQ01033852.1.p1 GENE.GHRQ01033852.1~~GHRQ01033852.1.p1  ORF type:complete len:211 (+),score=47.25 GHRQ01033852.1:240-872(+)
MGGGWNQQKCMPGTVNLSPSSEAVRSLTSSCAAVPAAGVVQRWQGPVGVLRPGGCFERLGADVALYVACRGMRHLAQHMADEVAVSSSGGVSVVRPMWVSRMAASPSSNGWQLTGNRKGQGTFGAVVIAHNGKCANRCASRRASTYLTTWCCRQAVFNWQGVPDGGLHTQLARDGNSAAVLLWHSFPCCCQRWQAGACCCCVLHVNCCCG